MMHALALFKYAVLSADDRGGFTTLRQLMEPVIDEMNEPDEDTLGASKDVVYTWKTLRLVARDSLPSFAAAVRAKGDLSVAARSLYPEEVPPEIIPTEQATVPVDESEKVEIEEEQMPDADQQKLKEDVENIESDSKAKEEGAVVTKGDQKLEAKTNCQEDVPNAVADEGQNNMDIEEIDEEIDIEN